ncbi:PREDICTED: uncharacterized protein LOC105561831 [Vollenhovia emeryi]|uniref:uncharacterized protein LOC105561831 n=1 Tax=Vollenhovia emeryi TaxID=411798 RepID=UPI0005F56C50|nr:PREDICTED: uncharacterized protein LOC105561831 [Vollenhovia emeryi]
MGGTCVVSDCKSTNMKSAKTAEQLAVESTKRISFHRFPTDAVQRAKWAKILNIKNEAITKKDRSVVCSLHFNEKFFDRSCSTKTMLKANAVPCVLKNSPYSKVTCRSIGNNKKSSSTRKIKNAKCETVQDVKKTPTSTELPSNNIKEGVAEEMDIEEAIGPIVKQEHIIAENDEEYDSFTQNDYMQIPVIQAVYGEENMPVSLFHETYGMPKISLERIQHSYNNEMKDVTNTIMIANLYQEIGNLKDVVWETNKKILMLENVLNELRN